MSKHRLLPLLVVALAMCLACGLAAGCASSADGSASSATSAGAAATSTSAELGAGATVLEVVGPEGTKSYTLDQVRAMPAVEGYGGMKSSTGHITPPALMKGVRVEDLFAEVGGFPEDMAVGIVAKDGYEMTVSYTQLSTGDFLTYDMATGAENEVEGPLQLIVAYAMDGQPLDPEGWGTLRLAIIGPEKQQVTDGHWWVKWVTALQVKPIVAEWSVTLSGSLVEEMDRATFETGATIGCHGQEWKDANGDTWTGIPLYLLCGRVDDDNAHSGPAYNRDLANTGYEVELISSDGSSVKIDSQTMYYNKNLIVAHLLNGEALAEEDWPLRLMGEGLDADMALGAITEIRLLLPEE